MEKQIETQAELWQYAEKHKTQIEKSLRRHLPFAPPQIQTEFNAAVEYALFSGGKRLRPVLTLLGAELFGGKPENILPAAAAVEFIHTSSLIFDDLPCMDDSNERRGNASLHAQFGEGPAVLVAIAFLNVSYSLVFVNQKIPRECAIRAHAEIVECVGASGMVGGQSIDLAMAKGAGANVGSGYESESIRNLKTSALMRLSLRVGAILAGAGESELAPLSRFAELLGDAYQLGDDLIDLREDGEIFGENKTFAINQGQTNARMHLHNLTERAKFILTDNFQQSEARGCLIQLTDYLAERKA
ncbi:MAG TPA: polyprenyl synthetase family protein [Pyrinomonadaceae bacterium]|nr:polyprenyl synthetase family protein [Pyrinomonadaceae bacterium]